METKEFVELIHYNIYLAKSKGIEPTHITVNVEWAKKIVVFFQSLYGSYVINTSLPIHTIMFCEVLIIFSEGVEYEKMIIGIDNSRL